MAVRLPPMSSASSSAPHAPPPPAGVASLFPAPRGGGGDDVAADGGARSADGWVRLSPRQALLSPFPPGCPVLFTDSPSPSTSASLSSGHVTSVSVSFERGAGRPLDYYGVALSGSTGRVRGRGGVASSTSEADVVVMRGAALRYAPGCPVLLEMPSAAGGRARGTVIGSCEMPGGGGGDGEHVPSVLYSLQVTLPGADGLPRVGFEHGVSPLRIRFRPTDEGVAPLGGPDGPSSLPDIRKMNTPQSVTSRNGSETMHFVGGACGGRSSPRRPTSPPVRIKQEEASPTRTTGTGRADAGADFGRGAAPVATPRGRPRAAEAPSSVTIKREDNVPPGDAGSGELGAGADLRGDAGTPTMGGQPPIIKCEDVNVDVRQTGGEGVDADVELSRSEAAAARRASEAVGGRGETAARAERDNDDVTPPESDSFPRALKVAAPGFATVRTTVGELAAVAQTLATTQKEGDRTPQQGPMAHTQSGRDKPTIPDLVGGNSTPVLLSPEGCDRSLSDQCVPSFASALRSKSLERSCPLNGTRPTEPNASSETALPLQKEGPMGSTDHSPTTSSLPALSVTGDDEEASATRMQSEIPPKAKSVGRSTPAKRSMLDHVKSDQGTLKRAKSATLYSGSKLDERWSAPPVTSESTNSGTASTLPIVGKSTGGYDSAIDAYRETWNTKQGPGCTSVKGSFQGSQVRVKKGTDRYCGQIVLPKWSHSQKSLPANKSVRSEVSGNIEQESMNDVREPYRGQILVPKTLGQKHLNDTVIGVGRLQHAVLMTKTQCMEIKLVPDYTEDHHAVDMSHETKECGEKAAQIISDHIANSVDVGWQKQLRSDLIISAIQVTFSVYVPEWLDAGSMEVLIKKGRQFGPKCNIKLKYKACGIYIDVTGPDQHHVRRVCVFIEHLILESVEVSQRGRALYEMGVSTSSTRARCEVIHQRSPHDFNTKVWMSLLLLPTNLSKCHKYVAALVGDGGNLRHLQERAGCTIEIFGLRVPNFRTRQEWNNHEPNKYKPYILVMAHDGGNVKAGVSIVRQKNREVTTDFIC